MAKKNTEVVELSLQRQSRINIISQLYKRGYSTREIRNEVAKRLDYNDYTLRLCQKDIAAMIKEWREERFGNVNDVISLELARLDEMTREAWVAWERSKDNSKKTIQRQRAMPNEEGESSDDVSIVSMEQEQVEETQVGDPRFLQIINQLGAERRKILGLYAPERHEVTGADGGPIENRFTGFSFLPWTDGLQNSGQSKIASGEVVELIEEEKPVVDYAEIVSEEDVRKYKQETAGGV